MRVDWRSFYEGVGNSFGYAMHDRKSREACAALGWTFSPDAPIAVTVAPTHCFQPAPGKRNLLYTAWEAVELPEIYKERGAAADLICVPAPFLKEPFELATGRPVFVVPLGVDPAFRFVDRSRGKLRPWATRDKPFRFLWVGAPNDRKGIAWVFQAFRLFTEGPQAEKFKGKVELYVKTSLPEGSPEQQGIVKAGPITIDDRRVPEAELVRLYHSAHCFVFPTLGEGFGLTAAEAAATGLPVIYPPHTAMPQLFDESSGFPLELETQTDHWTWTDCDGNGTPMAVDVTLQVPTVASVCQQMLRVYRDPPSAFVRGARAAEHMRQFTWARTADLLTAALASL